MIIKEFVYLTFLTFLFSAPVLAEQSRVQDLASKCKNDVSIVVHIHGDKDNDPSSMLAYNLRAKGIANAYSESELAIKDAIGKTSYESVRLLCDSEAGDNCSFVPNPANEFDADAGAGCQAELKNAISKLTSEHI